VRYCTRVESLREFRARLRGLVSPATIRDLVESGDLDLTHINGQPRIVTRYVPAASKGARDRGRFLRSVAANANAPSAKRGVSENHAIVDCEVSASRPEVFCGDPELAMIIPLDSTRVNPAWSLSVHTCPENVGVGR
jgi:hypothetical protein